MNIFKKFGAASYVSAAAFILALAGLITMCVSNATPGYGLDNFGTGIALAAVALVAIALVVASGLKLGGQSPLTAVLRVAPVLLPIVGASVLIPGRAGPRPSVLTLHPKDRGRTACHPSHTARPGNRLSLHSATLSAPSI